MNKRNIIVKTISYTLTVLMAAAFIFFVDMGWNVKEVWATLASEASCSNGQGEYMHAYVESKSSSEVTFVLYNTDGTKESKNMSIIAAPGGIKDASSGSWLYLNNYTWTVCSGPHGHTHSYSAATCTQPAKCSCGDTNQAALGHNFTSKTTTDAYLKSAATCTDKAVYYYKCVRCDEKGTETYEYGESLGHDWNTEVWSNDASHHWHDCKRSNCPTTDISEKNGYDTHDWKYISNGNTVTAKCSVEGCYYHTNGATMTLSVPTGNDAVYTGSGIPATVSEWSVSGSTTLVSKPGTVTYSGQDLLGNSYGPSETAPSNAGSYTAKITVGEADVTNSLTISPRSSSVFTISADEDEIENDKIEIKYADGATISPTFVVKDGDTELALDTDYVIVNGSTMSGSSVGEYTIKAAGIGNYAGQKEFKWSIINKDFDPSTITVTPYEGVYDAEPHSITVTVPEGATVEYSMTSLELEEATGGTNPTFTDVNGEGTVVYYKISKYGYNDVYGNSTVKITKAPLTVIPCEEQFKEYSDSDSKLVLKYAVNGLKGADENKDITSVISGSLKYSDQDTYGDLAPVGTYPISGTFTADNYEVTVATGVTFEVKPKPIKLEDITLNFNEEYCTGSDVVNDVKEIIINSLTLERDKDYEVSGETTASVFGPHTIKVDGIGNYTGSVDITWNLADNTSPDGDITIADNSVKKPIDSTTFGWFNKKSQTVTITASDRDSGVDKVYYYASDVIMTEDEVKNISEWTEYKASFEINPDIKVVVYAKITDKSGNLTYLGSDGLVLDGTDPVIEGIENGMTYCIDAKEITVTDGNLEKVTVNGDEVTLVDGKYTLEAANKKYTVIATDKAGNVTAVVVTINDHHTYGEYVPNNNGNTQSAGTEEAHCIYCDNIDIREIKGTKVDVPVEKSNEESSKIGTGIVKVSVNKDKNCPQATIDNFGTDLAKSLLTPAEIQEVADGASAYIFLDIVNIDGTVSSCDKASIEKIAKNITSGTAKVGMYLDISLFKKLSTSPKTDRITDTKGKPLEIAIKIPQSLINTNEDINRRYYIARVHDGETSLLDTKYDSENKTVTTSSGLFSTYALLYVDTAIEKNNITVEYHSSNNSNNKVETYTIASPVLLANSINANVLAPKTGDDFNIVGWITALFAVILLSGGIVLYERRKSK